MIDVIIDEQHELLPQQKQLLDSTFGEKWKRFNVPAQGLTIEGTHRAIEELSTCVFVSPVTSPYLLMTRVISPGLDHTYLMHNDKRELIEKNGAISTKVAADGWQLIKF